MDFSNSYLFSYETDLVILSDSFKYLNIIFKNFFFNLTAVGLSSSEIKIPYFFQKSRIIRFIFVGFEFILVKRQLRIYKDIFNCDFIAFIKPEQVALYYIKLRIRRLLRYLYRVSLKYIYLIFFHLNLIISK
jgi:hypothetical protein